MGDRGVKVVAVLSPDPGSCQNNVWPGVNPCPKGSAGIHYSSHGRVAGGRRRRLSSWEGTRAKACLLALLACAIGDKGS